MRHVIIGQSTTFRQLMLIVKLGCTKTQTKAQQAPCQSTKEHESLVKTQTIPLHVGYTPQSKSPSLVSTGHKRHAVTYTFRYIHMPLHTHSVTYTCRYIHIPLHTHSVTYTCITPHCMLPCLHITKNPSLWHKEKRLVSAGYVLKMGLGFKVRV